MEEITRFLREIPPFSQLSTEKLQRLTNTIQIEYFPASHDILSHAGTPAEHLYIIQRGSVDLVREGTNGDVHLLDTLGEGDVFGYVSLIRNSPSVTVRTREETLTYLLPAAVFHDLRKTVPSFAQFFASSAIERLTHRLHARDANAAPELFRLRLRDIVGKNLISVPPDVTIREAAQVMSNHNVSSVVITSTPPGILTDRDLRNRVLAGGISDSTPVTEVMTSPVETLPGDSLVFEALVRMLERGFHHMPVTEDDRIIGMVTHTDILRQQSKSPLFLPRLLQRAQTAEDLRIYTHHVTVTVGSLLDAGARITNIGRVVAVAHDALTIHLLRQAEKKMGPPPCPYAWLVLGSEGRYEQTLRTDQDNALVYCSDAPPEVRSYFADLADYVVNQLVASGFPPCPGNIMANNPEWCQPLNVWQDYFEQWIAVPRENTLLRRAIFFDYRKIYGNLDVETALRPIIRQGHENRVFLGRFARVAIRHPAPLSFFRQLVVERNGESRDLIDLKVRGTGLVVDLARLFALEAGCHHTSTMERLRSCVRESSLSQTGADELSAAFELISLLRLRHQYQQLKQGEEVSNQVPVSWLSAFERRELKEALWAIARIQQNTELLFQIDLFA
jgi:CBS domain-containing protein